MAVVVRVAVGSGGTVPVDTICVAAAGRVGREVGGVPVMVGVAVNVCVGVRVAVGVLLIAAVAVGVAHCLA